MHNGPGCLFLEGQPQHGRADMGSHYSLGSRVCSHSLGGARESQVLVREGEEGVVQQGHKLDRQSQREVSNQHR